MVALVLPCSLWLPSEVLVKIPILLYCKVTETQLKGLKQKQVCIGSCNWKVREQRWDGASILAQLDQIMSLV